MLFASTLWTALGLLVVGAKYSYGSAIHDRRYPYYNTPSSSTTTRTLEQTIPSHSSTSTTTHTLEQPIPSHTSTSATTYTLEQTIPSHTSTSTSTHTLEQTIPSHTSTSWSSNSTVGSTTTLYVTSSKTITTSIPTYPPSTSTTTTYVPTTITPSPTPPPNPCPTFCSISAGTVNLFFWPTNEPYTYPSTYVDTALDYTFTSPSVYMVVNTIFGYNSAGLAGPSGTSVVFALDLDQVSTIVPGVSATQQLTLSDLGTDCPQSEAASVIATAAPDGRCDPILAAPDPVKSWALPCNACGRFGLFDPPYAVPPLTGGLVPGPVTTTMAQPQPQTTTSVAPATATSTPVAPTPTPLSTTSSSSATGLGIDPNATITMVTASEATREMGGLACLILSLFVSVCLL